MDAARLKEGSRVLDVGFGTGESLIMLLSHLSVPRPSTVAGITSLPRQTSRAQRRVNQLLDSDSFEGRRPEVDLHATDAIFRENQANHPLDPSIDRQFDAILAIDCAYHFNSREKFLSQAFKKLAPGGRIALADICFGERDAQGAVTKAFRTLVRWVPGCNRLSAKEYGAQMERAGYVDISIQDVSEHVFPGFLAFLRDQGVWWRMMGFMLRTYASADVRFVIAAGSKMT